MEAEIHRLSTRFQIAERDRDALPRLRRLRDRLVEEGLPRALAAADVGPNEEICLRHVDAACALDLDQPDGALLETWIQAMTVALRGAIAGGSTRDLVRFPSRRAALLDGLLALIEDDRERAWAWRRLGLPVEGPADEAVVALMVAASEAIPALLVEVIRRGRWAALTARLRVGHWVQLAEAALTAHGLPRHWVALARENLPNGAMPPAAEWDRLGRSAFWQAIAQAGPARAAGRETSSTAEAAWAWAPALATLVLLAELPGRLVSAGANGLHWIRALAMKLVADQAAGQGRAVAQAAGEDHPLADALGPAHEEALHRAPSARVRRAQPTENIDDLPASLLRRPRGRTEAGGLLYLVHLVDEQIEELVGALPERPLPWVLHTLACGLVPGLDPHDPAALAFCGLNPEADPPDGEAPTEAEVILLAHHRAVLVAALALALQAEAPTEEVLAQTVARSALILADPGWIEVHLELSAVDVAVRRAGLDLDPGFVPWLGVVLRFVYA